MKAFTNFLGFAFDVGVVLSMFYFACIAVWYTTKPTKATNSTAVVSCTCVK